MRFKELSGFSEICNGIKSEELETLIRLLKIYPKFKYTMIGKIIQIKKLRQSLVIDYYFKMHYPNGEKNLESLFSNMELY